MDCCARNFCTRRMTVQFAPCINLCTLYGFFMTTRPMRCRTNWGHRSSSLVRSPPFSRMLTLSGSLSYCRNFNSGPGLYRCAIRNDRLPTSPGCHSQPSSCRSDCPVNSTSTANSASFRSCSYSVCTPTGLYVLILRENLYCGLP
jgi:hypothetical protein